MNIIQSIWPNQYKPIAQSINFAIDTTICNRLGCDQHSIGWLEFIRDEIGNQLVYQ